MQTVPSSDVLLAVTFDLNDPSREDDQPVNFNWGDVDTNVFDTNVADDPGLEGVHRGRVDEQADHLHGRHVQRDQRDDH